jgi:branched-chain amino acid transport system substrate-binding protein
LQQFGGNVDNLIGRRYGALALTVAFLGVVACGQSTGSTYVENGQPLAFATVQPYTGPNASFGPELGAGCYPAARVIAAAGGVLGHKTVTCSAVDSRGDPVDAVPAVQKMLATVANLKGVLGPASNEALATLPLLNSAHIPMVCDSGQPVLDTNTLPYYWRITPSDDYWGYAMAIYSHDQGYKRVALVFGNDISSQGLVPTADAGVKKLGDQVVIKQELTLDQSSYRSEVEQLIAASPDVIFGQLDPQTASTYLAELKQLHGGIPPLILYSAQYTPWLQAVSAVVGTATLAQSYHVLIGSTVTSGSAFDDYNTNLLASSADVPNPAQWSNDIYSQSGFDSVVMMALAMLAAGTTDNKVWNSYLPKVTTAGPNATIVHTFAEGKAALAAGKTIAYEGAIGSIQFDRFHNSGGGFEVLGYAPGNGQQPVLKTYGADAVANLVNLP